MSNIVLRFVADKEILLRDFLLSKLISKKTLTRIKFDGDGSIKVNHKEENVRYQLSLGDVVEVTLPSENYSQQVRFFDDPLDIMYEDEYLLIVNKPHHLSTIPSRNTNEKSLLEMVNFYFKKNHLLTIPHIVTRLDRNTSGLVLIAKHRHIHSLLSKLAIDKYYLGLCHGNFYEHIIIEANIARKNDSIIERMISPSGDYAKTVAKRVAYYPNRDISLVSYKLFTGRTHQIRLHSQHIGHSLLGDELYGGKTDLINRQALHCYHLSLNHPITFEKLDIKCPLADDIQNILECD